MSFQDDLMRAEAIREIRASGCTTEGVAELIVEFHGAVHVLTHVAQIQKLGDEVAASDSEQGAKMRQLLLEAASKAEAIAMQAAAGKTAAPAQLGSAPAENAANDVAKEAVDWLVKEHGYSEPTAKEIVEKEGSEAILGEKKWKQANAEKTSKPAESQAVPDTGKGDGTGSAPVAAASAGTSGDAAAAAGTSAAESKGAASESGSQGEGQAQGS